MDNKDQTTVTVKLDWRSKIGNCDSRDEDGRSQHLLILCSRSLFVCADPCPFSRKAFRQKAIQADHWVHTRFQ